MKQLMSINCGKEIKNKYKETAFNTIYIYTIKKVEIVIIMSLIILLKFFKKL
jgi:hypothetical protein